MPYFTENIIFFFWYFYSDVKDAAQTQEDSASVEEEEDVDKEELQSIETFSQSSSWDQEVLTDPDYEIPYKRFIDDGVLQINKVPSGKIFS